MNPEAEELLSSMAAAIYNEERGDCLGLPYPAIGEVRKRAYRAMAVMALKEVADWMNGAGWDEGWRITQLARPLEAR